MYKNIQEVETKFSAILKHLDKNELLIQLSWQREAFSRSFFKEYQGFSTNEFLSSNLLILRIMKEPFFKGRKKIKEAEIEAIVEGFKKLIENKEMYLLLMNGLAEASQWYDKMKIFGNERYFSILKTFEDNDIMVESKAEEKIKEYLPILESRINVKQTNSVSYSPEEFIKNFYVTLNQFYCCLLRNEIFEEVFGLFKKYKDISLTPNKLMDFVNSYLMNQEKLTHTSVSEFIQRANKHFGIDEKKIREFLLFYENRSNNFPLFILINGRVYISHRTAFLIYI